MTPLRLVIALCVLVLGMPAHAAPRLLALDDVYDCAFSPDGTLVAATGGGLRIGAKIVTALDGLPDTRVDHLTLQGDHVLAETRAGSAQVSLASGRVSKVTMAASAPRLPSSFERFGEGMVRARARLGSRRCIATSEGLFVSDGAQPPARIASISLPTGDVAALAIRARGLYVGTFDRGLYVVDGLHATPVVDAALSPHVNALAFDSARAVLWVATARGLVRCQTASSIVCRGVGDRLAMHALLLRDDGSLIAGGEERILFVGRDGRVDGAATRKEGARFRSVWSLARGKDGTIFAGTTSGIFYGDEPTFTRDPSTLRRASMVSGALPDDWVTALLLEGDELVAGTYNAGVVTLLRHAGTLSLRDADPTLGYVNPAGLTRLPDGSLAVSTMDGLRVGHLGDFRTVPTLGRDVTAVMLDAHHARWVASRRGIEQLDAE